MSSSSYKLSTVPHVPPSLTTTGECIESGTITIITTSSTTSPTNSISATVNVPISESALTTKSFKETSDSPDILPIKLPSTSPLLASATSSSQSSSPSLLTTIKTNPIDDLIVRVNINSSPTTSPGSVKSTPVTPAKFLSESEKSSSPSKCCSYFINYIAVLCHFMFIWTYVFFKYNFYYYISVPKINSKISIGTAPRHLKKAWLQRHTGGEDNDDTIGITGGGGNCVKLPLTLTLAPSQDQQYHHNNTTKVNNPNKLATNTSNCFSSVTVVTETTENTTTSLSTNPVSIGSVNKSKNNG